MALLTDSELPKTIYSALKSVMGEIVIKRETQGEYDPNTGTVTEGGVQTYKVRGMIEDFSVGSLQRSQSFLDGSIIRPGDRKATLLAYGAKVKPTPTDTIHADGRDWMILSVVSDPSNSTYEILIRGI